jgi:hypothetical protein
LADWSAAAAGRRCGASSRRRRPKEPTRAARSPSRGQGLGSRQAKVAFCTFFFYT